MKTAFLKKLSYAIADARMAVAYQTSDAQHKTEVAFAAWMEYLNSLSDRTRKRGDQTATAVEDFYKSNQVQGIGSGAWPCATCVSGTQCAWKPSTPEKRKLEELPPLPTLKRCKTEIMPGDDDLLEELLKTCTQPTDTSD